MCKIYDFKSKNNLAVESVESVEVDRERSIYISILKSFYLYTNYNFEDIDPDTKTVDLCRLNTNKFKKILNDIFESLKIDKSLIENVRIEQLFLNLTTISDVYLYICSIIEETERK